MTTVSTTSTGVNLMKFAMTPETTTNKYARHFVNDKEQFKASNCFGTWVTANIYAVYSYGFHFPMYVWDANEQQWFGNSLKYSRTTSKQQSQLRPDVDNIKEFTTGQLKQLVSSGSLVEYVIQLARSDNSVTLTLNEER